METSHIASDAAFLSFGEDQTAIWTETPGSSQPALEFDWNLDDTVGNIDWNPAARFENPAHSDTAPASFEATNAVGFDPALTYPYSHPGDSNWMYPDFLAPWPTPAMTPFPSARDMASSQSDVSLARLIHSPTEAVVEPQVEYVPTSSTAPSQANLSWLEDPSVDFISTVGTTSFNSGRSTDFSIPPLSWADVGACQNMSPATHMLATPRTLRRKRPRVTEAGGECVEVASNGDRCDPHKRVKRSMTANGGLGSGGGHKSSLPESCHQDPRKSHNSKSEVARCGAGKLATRNAHEVYYRLLPGPSVQESMEATVQEQPPWVEGTEVADRDLFCIPKYLSERHRSFLAATSGDWTRGAVRELKCRLCPAAAFSHWEDYKRHCDLMEAHPLKISFCSFCGDFFARTDALARHCKSRPPECLAVTPDEALAKRRETERVHREFQEKLERCLRDDEDIGTTFSQSIKEMYPGSSKRGSRQQSRLKVTGSEP